MLERVRKTVTQNVVVYNLVANVCLWKHVIQRKFILTRFLLINRGCAKKARERGRRVGVVLAKKRPRK